MKKVLLFGDSHLGAWKQGVELISEPGFASDFEIHYLGLPGPEFFQFRYSNGILSTASPEVMLPSGMQTCPLDLAVYDKIIIVAGPNPCHFGRFHGWVNHKSFIQPLSRSAISAIIYSLEFGFAADQANSKTATAKQEFLASMVRDLGSKCILIGAPLSPEGSPTGRFLKALLPEVRAIVQSNYLTIQDLCAQSLRQSTTHGVLMPCRELLCDHGLMTLNSFMDKDLGHANPMYGKLMAETLFYNSGVFSGT